MENTTKPINTAMSNNLTPEDKELIKILEKKVDRLYKAMFPDDQPDNEVEYVEIFHNDKYRFNIANSYGAVCQIDKDGEELQGCYALIYPDGHKGHAFKDCCRTSTREAYLAQTTPVNGEWKEGEWAWSSKHKTFLGTIDSIDLSQALTVCLDNQNGTKEWFGITEYLVKPTPEEIQSHLTRIAEQRGFKAYVRIKSDYVPYNGEEWVIPEGERFIYDKGENWLLLNNHEIWRSGKWASILPKEVEQKERWQPTYGCKYWYIGIEDGNIFISDFHWGNDDVDFICHDTANCFKTQEEAERAVQAIRETLKNL